MLIQRDIAKATWKGDWDIAPGTVSKRNRGDEAALSLLLHISAYGD